MNFLPTFLWSASTFGVFFLPAAISTLAVADFQEIKESTLQETWDELLDRYHRNMAWA